MKDESVPPDMAAVNRKLDDYERRITIHELCKAFASAARLAAAASTLAVKHTLFDRAAAFDERALRALGHFRHLSRPRSGISWSSALRKAA